MDAPRYQAAPLYLESFDVSAVQWTAVRAERGAVLCNCCIYLHFSIWQTQTINAEKCWAKIIGSKLGNIGVFTRSAGFEEDLLRWQYPQYIVDITIIFINKTDYLLRCEYWLSVINCLLSIIICQTSRLVTDWQDDIIRI